VPIVFLGTIKGMVCERGGEGREGNEEKLGYVFGGYQRRDFLGGGGGGGGFSFLVFLLEE